MVLVTAPGWLGDTCVPDGEMEAKCWPTVLNNGEV